MVAQSGKFTKNHWIFTLEIGKFYILWYIKYALIELFLKKTKKQKKLSGWLWSTSRCENHWIPIYLSYDGNWNPEREMIHPVSQSEFIQSQNASDLWRRKRKQRAGDDLVKWTKGNIQL